MLIKRVKHFFGLSAFSLLISFNGSAAPSLDACANPSLLDLTDRGSVTKTPCALSFNSVMFEAGYQNQALDLAGTRQNFIQPVLFIELPDYNKLSIDDLDGYSATVVSVKHEIGYGKNWVAATAVHLTLPSGSSAFGSQGLGAKIDGIIKYAINPQFALTLMLGGSTETEPTFVEGRRFNSFLPSIVLTYAPNEKLNFFAELFGKTKTNSESGGNYNADVGFFYLVTSSCALDLEVGQQLSNEITSFNRFINAGITIKI